MGIEIKCHLLHTKYMHMRIHKKWREQIQASTTVPMREYALLNPITVYASQKFKKKKVSERWNGSTVLWQPAFWGLGGHVSLSSTLGVGVSEVSKVLHVYRGRAGNSSCLFFPGLSTDALLSFLALPLFHPRLGNGIFCFHKLSLPRPSG